MRGVAAGGFTLGELAVVLGIASLLILLGVPALLATLDRQKLTGASRQTAQLFHLARMEAIRNSAPTRVVQVHEPHPTQARPGNNSGSVFAYIDLDSNGVPGPNDRPVGQRFQLPRGVSWQGPGDSGATNNNGAWNFPGPDNDDGVATFMPDGTVVFEDTTKDAAFRLTDGDNHLEVRIENPLTATIVIQKFFGGADVENNWFEDGEVANCDGDPDQESCQWTWS
jgi:type II secretory pathway pseudopilin PulG